MMKRIFCALLSLVMLLSGLVVSAEPVTEASNLFSETVVFVNGSSNHEGEDDGSLEKPYKSFNKAVAEIADIGGTVVITGATDCTTETEGRAVIGNTADITITSVWNGVDYRGTTKYTRTEGYAGAYLSVGHLLCSPVENPGRIFIDKLDIITVSWANWHICGHPFEITSDTTIIYWWNDSTGAASGYYNDISVQFMVTGSNVNNIPESFGELPEIKIASPMSSSSRIYVGAKKNVTIGGASFNLASNFAKFVPTANGSGALTIIGDIKVLTSKKISAVESAGTLAKFRGDFAIVGNPGSTLPTSIPDSVKPTDGSWYIVKVGSGASAKFGERAKNLTVTLDNPTAYNFIILNNTTSGTSYAFPIKDGAGEVVLAESGVYNMTYTNAQAVTVSFADENGETVLTEVVTTKDNPVRIPALESNEIRIFRGWSEVEGADTAMYEAGDSVKFEEDTVLYAVWSDAPKYTVEFKVDGEAYAEFVNVEGAKIQYPELPKKDGYYFKCWDKTPERLGAQDIEICAVFVSKELYGNVVYLDGTAESEGDGTIGEPFKTLSAAGKFLGDEDGTIVVSGVTVIEYSGELNCGGDILITSKDPVTGNNYIVSEVGDSLGEGAYLSNYKGAFLGNGEGKLTFDNVALYCTKSWNFFNLCARETVIGANTKFYLQNGDKVSKGTYLGLASQHVTDKNNINIKATIAAPASYYAAWLARAGASTTINSVDITFDTYLQFNFGNNSDSVAPVVNGPVMFTVNSSATGLKIAEGGKMLDFGAKAYLSVITNDATVKFVLPVEALADKTFMISSDGNGKVTHTGKKGQYRVDSDSFNIAQLLDSEGACVSEAVIGTNGGILTAEEYGEYTVSYSSEPVYTLKYSSQNQALSDACPEEYAVKASDTEALTIKLPEPEERVGYAFVGWAVTSDGNAQYYAGDEFVLSADIELYAVWEEIKTYTVTFRDDEGNELHSVTGYAGDLLTFPEKAVLPWDYEKKLLGFKYADDEENTLLSDKSVIPESDKTAVPLWGDIPSDETRVYVNAKLGSDENDGKTPSRAVATISKAVSIVKESGGVIVCVDGEINLTGAWNNSADITLTSLDPLTGIDYRASEISADGLSWKSGAYLWHGPVQFGTEVISGAINLDHLLIGTHADYQFLNFDGHPFTLGKGISAFNRNKDTGKITTTQTFYIRALGEANASRTNSNGINFTLNTLGNGATIYAIGKAENVIPSLNITVDSEFGGTIHYGNNSNGGTTTLRGLGRFTFNADLKNSIRFPTFTNPVEGNLYAIYNNNSTGALFNIVQAPGYGIMTVTSSSDAKITHAETAGDFIVTLNSGYTHRYVKILDSSKRVVRYAELQDGVGFFSLSDMGDYTAEYTDVSCHRVTYVTGTDEISVPYSYFEDGSEAELAANIYRYGYIFKGWSDGEKIYSDGVLTMPARDITLTAVWEEAPKYTVSFDGNGVSCVLPESIVDYVDEEYKLEKLSFEGKVFLGWSEDSDAKSGFMNYTVKGDKTLYAIWSETAAYTLEARFRDDDRWQFQRYVVDIYLENGSASEGTVKFEIDNALVYSLGRIPASGIDSTLTRSGRVCTLTWSGAADAETARVKLATVMLFYTEYGMEYENLMSRTSDELVAPVDGCLIDGKEALCSASFYKGVTGEAIKLSGRVIVEGREPGTAPKYGFATLTVRDFAGDTVQRLILEDENTLENIFQYDIELYSGEYTFTVEKPGYKDRTVSINVSDDEEVSLPELVIYPGDTVDGSGKGDGLVDIDDFTRVLKGFSSDFPTELRYAVDLDENGSVGVTDLAIVKSYFGTKLKDYTVEEQIDSSLPALDWSISLNGTKLIIKGGSGAAVEKARSFAETEYTEGYAAGHISHSEEYPMADIRIGDVGIGDYRIRIGEDSGIAEKYALVIRDRIASVTGRLLEIVDDSDGFIPCEIIVGFEALENTRAYEAYEDGGRLLVSYGNEEGADLATRSLLGDLLGMDSGNPVYTVIEGDRYEGEWEVLSRFAVFSDTHVGKGKVPANPDWEDYESWLKPVYDHINEIHENPETRLDFVLSLGDNIDYGYDRGTAAEDALRDYDYNSYLETIKWLTCCDAENPIEGRAEGKIPHYELQGNHDPSGVIRFLDKAYWVSENADGKKVAYIGFFTNYGGYPNINGDTSTYFSYGNLTDETVEYVESMILKAVQDGAEHIVLSSHFGIAQDLGAPILPETGLGKISQLCEKYGIKLFFNGHEHDPAYTVRRYEEVYDVDCSMTRSKHAVVEITTSRAKISVYKSSDNSLEKEYYLTIG